ncbi:hypothetical protein CDV31_002965 [Fusarium ambrosium]|uniref:Uncharacterized protein n=1 Tax=Fusarium ambrosium TaxID=131363 RepID=A0A428UVB9_9HYPO|nr:hypothetical protein CDV31_002965 [Fusarium ambrosium]
MEDNRSQASNDEELMHLGRHLQNPELDAITSKAVQFAANKESAKIKRDENYDRWDDLKSGLGFSGPLRTA